MSVILLLSVLFCTIALNATPPYSLSICIRFPLVVLVQIGACCFVLGVLAIFSIGYNPYVVIASNILLGAMALLYVLREKRTNGERMRRRPRIGTRDDFVVLALILASVAICAFAQFGFPPRVSFSTTDPAIHLRVATNVFEGGVVEGQYFTHVFSAICLNIFSPLVDSFHYYVIFAYAEEFLFILSGMMFYSLICVTCRKLRLSWKLALVFLYIFGYPLNNMIYGFSYLGAGVSIVSAIIFLCHEIPRFKTTLPIFYALLSLLSFSLIISYVLFAPPVFAGVFVFLIRYAVKSRRDTAKRIVGAFFALGIPFILGFLVMYLPVFGAETSVGDAIAIEGGAFRSLYAGFIFIAPLALYGFACSWKKPEFVASNLVTLFFVAFALCLFVACFNGLASTYYFYKTYYVIWMLLFFYSASAIVVLRNRAKGMLACYSALWILVLSLSVSGIDNRLNATRPRLDPDPIADSLFPIYTYNRESIGVRGLDEGTIELYMAADGYLSQGKAVGMLSNDYDQTWFKTLLRNEGQKDLWAATDEEIKSDINDSEYLVIREVPDAFPSKSGSNYSDMRTWVPMDSEVVFENESGYIVKLPETVKPNR